ncbi:flagellar biosynthetic protein FliR, partial [Paracoccaceae bacterium]|nr:flagellar biosynthetic protein FliR [Paracoccaceae bacterium]
MEYPLNDIIPGLDLQNIIEILLAFFLTSIRLSAFIIASPFFSARFIMLRVRIIIAFVISIIVFSIHPLELDTKILTSAYGIAVIFKEVAIGVTAGLILSIMFSAASLAGEKIATSA